MAAHLTFVFTVSNGIGQMQVPQLELMEPATYLINLVGGDSFTGETITVPKYSEEVIHANDCVVKIPCVQGGTGAITSLPPGTAVNGAQYN